jgi:hypothetical protein
MHNTPSINAIEPHTVHAKARSSAAFHPSQQTRDFTSECNRMMLDLRERTSILVTASALSSRVEVTKLVGSSERCNSDLMTHMSFAEAVQVGKLLSAHC